MFLLSEISPILMSVKSFKNYLLVLFALIAIATSIFAWKEYQELTGLRATALSPIERANLQKSAWDAQKHVQQLEPSSLPCAVKCELARPPPSPHHPMAAAPMASKTGH